jgi:hypothetical protein
VKAEGLAYGSGPFTPDDMKINDWNGGRGVYFRDPNHYSLIARRMVIRPGSVTEIAVDELANKQASEAPAVGLAGLLRTNGGTSPMRSASIS